MLPLQGSDGFGFWVSDLRNFDGDVETIWNGCFIKSRCRLAGLLETLSGRLFGFRVEGFGF